MENFMNVFAEAGPRTYWPMARAAHVDLQIMTRRRVNLLLNGTDAAVEDALTRLETALRAPVQTWSPHEPLELPPPTQTGSLILRDVGALSPIDQYRLLKWLELSRGRMQVVSTSTSSLLALVECGQFHDTLYYRLNVACVDLTE
jgi:hypothetical protein